MHRSHAAPNSRQGEPRGRTLVDRAELGRRTVAFRLMGFFTFFAQYVNVAVLYFRNPRRDKMTMLAPVEASITMTYARGL